MTMNPADTATSRVFVLSADDPDSLRERAVVLREFMSAHPEHEPLDIAYSLAGTDPRGEHRATVIAADNADLMTLLGQLASGEPHADICVGQAKTGGGVVLVYPGFGIEWPGMARQLLDSSATFRAEIAAFERALSPFTDWSLTDVLLERPGAPSLDRLDVAQPVSCAVSIALTALWREAGVEPDAVLGYSLGEIPAAHVSGALSLSDIARTVAHFSVEQASLDGQGAMMIAALSAERLTGRLAEITDRARVVGHNGPNSSVVAGDPDAVSAVLADLARGGIRAQRVPVGAAVHTAQFDGSEVSLRTALAPIRPRVARIPFCSTVTADLLDSEQLTGSHWGRNLRETVQFEAAMRRMLDYGYRHFLEIAPRPALTMSMHDIFENAGVQAVALGTLRRDDTSARRFQAAVAAAYVEGVPVDWTHHFAGTGARRISLPKPTERPPAAKTVHVPSVPVARGDGRRLREVMGLIQAQMTAVLGRTESGDPDRTFSEIGFDSLTAVQLRNGLNTATGLTLATTVIFDYATPAELARHIVAAETGAAGEPEAQPEADVSDEPIAIVGMSCRYPGGVGTPEELWRLVERGDDVISTYPEDRGWDAEHVRSSRTDRGGFLYDAADFDAELFGISPREALAMDPQQRLLLEVSWELFERAGIAPDSLRGSRTGVYIGMSGRDYAGDLLDQPDQAGGYLLAGNLMSVASGRIAYTYGFEGPAVTVDTACSASLVAMHLGARALRSGECSLAVVGGVTIMSTPALMLEFSRQGGLSGDGRCKSFAGAADGTGWGEGVGLVLLERLSDARRLGH
ncbi:beta-ketoacyl synthase N-terminal-like domain-containing protein, partial [Nocardia sp. NPDC055002]